MKAVFTNKGGSLKSVELKEIITRWTATHKVNMAGGKDDKLGIVLTLLITKAQKHLLFSLANAQVTKNADGSKP
jgi:hypothetical protein